jgi:hypothetical protein
VTAVHFAPRQVVRCGQTVAKCQPLWPGAGRGRGATSHEAPVSGLVTRRWVTPGDRVWRTSPVVSIASSENVLVVARFAAGTPVQAGSSSAAVLLDGSTRNALPATIITVVEAPEWATGDGEPEACPTRVVLSLPCAPAEALWPGARVQVEIQP